jgi:hypothetical protein
MPKVLFAGKVPGASPPQTVASIYEGGDDNPLYNPSGYITRVFFDSRFDYLNIVRQTDVSVTFAYEGVNTQPTGKKGKNTADIPRSGANTMLIDTHNLGYTPALVIYDLQTRRGVAGNRLVHALDNKSFRFIYVAASSSVTYLRESWFVRSVALPAKTIVFRLYYFNKPAN